MKHLIASAAIALALAATPALADDHAMEPAQIVSEADVSVGLNGLVCDFCATALKKVFGKQEEVAHSYVDLDTKLLSVVFKDGASMSDEEIRKLVKKAGYKATDIARKDS